MVPNDNLRPEIDEAAAALRRFATRYPVPALEEALMDLEQGHTVAAEHALEGIMELRSAAGPAGQADAVAAACYMSDLLALHHPSDAVAIYLTAVEIDPNAAYVWNRFGDLLIRMEDYKGAERSYREALRLGTKQADHAVVAWASVGLGNLANLSGNDESARQWWDQALMLSQSLGRMGNTGGVLGRASRQGLED